MKNRTLLLSLLFMIIIGFNLPAKSVILNFITDMFNQISIKPQEEGSMQEFPIGSVSIDGRNYEDPVNRFVAQIKEISPQTASQNPVAREKTSLLNGKFIFNTYCIVCHSDSREADEEGFASTSINKLGMVAPVLIPITHQFTDGYIHNKIKYGGTVMPSLGYATSAQDRWDVVNYIRELEKQP